MGLISTILKSSILKKQVVAITGLVLIGFVIGHLAGNFFIYGGPEAFNHYADKLKSLRPALNVVEACLVIIFFIHIFLTYLIVLENINARKTRYETVVPKEQTISSRLMPYTGTIILAFVIWHLMDFTFIDHNGPQSILKDGISYGLYGIVYNAFCNPVHSLFYIIAMLALGFHLSHAIQSAFQTFGFYHASYTPRIKSLSNFLSLIITFGYITIPVYIFIKNSNF